MSPLDPSAPLVSRSGTAFAPTSRHVHPAEPILETIQRITLYLLRAFFRTSTRAILRSAWPFLGGCGHHNNSGCRFGLILIKFNSVAAATITRIPARLSAICIAIPSEMSTSAMWLASASRTPRQ